MTNPEPGGQPDNTQTEGKDMDFGDAIRAMKAGKKVSRAGWNGKGMWVALTPGSTFAPAYAKAGHAAAHRAAIEPDAKWMPAWQDVLAERQRQISAEGWTPEHDDAHAGGQMALAAGCYAMFASASDRQRATADLPGGLASLGKTITGWSAWLQIWPWDRKWWKPTNRRRDLVKAGALILAEVERLDRAALKGGAA